MLGRPSAVARRSLPPMLALALAGALLAACGSSAPAQSERAPAALPGRQAQVIPAPVFENDPELEALIVANGIQIPPRFVLVQRSDRDAILTLGLVDAAARLTYNSATTNEVLSLDLLRLDDGVDGERFFAAFAESIADVPAFQGVRTVGVVRGIGEAARHLAFSVDGDDGDAVALIRDGIVALAVYRRPAGLIRAIDMGDLLANLDLVLQEG